MEAGTCYGRSEVPLAPGWRAWLPKLAERLASLAAVTVWSSPSVRCAAPAEALAARLGLPTRCDARLLELDFGRWEGCRWDQLCRTELDRWAADPRAFAAPGGETGDALIARSRSFAGMLLHRAEACIVVAHGGPLRLLPTLLHDPGGDPDLLARPMPPGGVQVIRLRR